MKSTNKNKLLIIAPILVMVIIVILSAFPISSIWYENKTNLGGVLDFKNRIEGLLNIDISFSVIQNMMHIPFYAVLAFLWMAYLCKKREAQFLKAGLYALGLTLLFGVLDEAHQFFVSGRDASLMDLGLDLFGGFLGILIYRIKNNKDKLLTAN